MFRRLCSEEGKGAHPTRRPRRRRQRWTNGACPRSPMHGISQLAHVTIPASSITIFARGPSALVPGRCGCCASGQFDAMFAIPPATPSPSMFTSSAAVVNSTIALHHQPRHEKRMRNDIQFGRHRRRRWPPQVEDDPRDLTPDPHGAAMSLHQPFDAEPGTQQ